MTDQHERLTELLDELRKPFHPSQVIWKPGAVKGDRALAMPYADLRAYMNRLDEVCGDAWEVNYEPWGPDRIICRLTISGVTRSSTGESDKESEKSEIGGTVAEAQAFKRAAAMFGLGRYLYNLPTGWADYDPATRKFTEKAKAKLTGILVQHYRRATDSAQNAPQAPQTPQDAIGTTNGSDDTSLPPTNEELETIRQWANRTEAEMWAVMIGACENEHEARNSLEKSIAKCGGKVTKDNYICVYVDFLRHQYEKLAEQEAQAQPA